VLLALLEVPNCAVMTICIDEDHLFADLDRRIESRLRSATTVTLEPYSQSELVDILAARVRHGLDEDRVTDAALTHIVDTAAGDAREAIGLLRRAAQQATETGRDITPELVEECAKAARRELRNRQVRSLGTHQRALYDVVCAAGSDGIRADNVRTQYEQRVQDPKPDRTRTRYLDSLERYDLISSEGAGRGKMYYPATDSHVGSSGTQ